MHTQYLTLYSHYLDNYDVDHYFGHIRRLLNKISSMSYLIIVAK